MQKTKLVSWTLLCTIVLSIMIVGVPIVTAHDPEGTYALFDAVDDDHSVEWVSGSEPGSYPFFDVKLMFTNVTNAYAASFSLEYDPAILNYSSHVWGDAFAASGKTVLPLDPTLDYTNGWIIQGSIGQLGPDSGSVKTYTDPSWGLVATFTFKFIGSPPALGSPINTLINITNVEGRTSSWWKFGSDPPEGAFLTYVSCGFHYEAQLGPVTSPVANFVWSPSGLLYEGATVNFDGSAPTYSTHGQDGDGTAFITQYWWDFGEGAGFALGTATPSHLYSTAGSYNVRLYVVAPGVPPYIDPTYVNTSAIKTKPLSIVVKAGTGIDVYTEAFRWPWYTTNGTGAGPNMNASCFRPQENVDLYAYVFYNDDAVQSKLVEFYIVGPDNIYGQFEFARTAFSSNGTVWNGTDWIPMPEGVAWLPFRIPWPCDNSEVRVFGIWTVTVRVSLPDVKPGEETIYEDTLHFKVCWGVTIVSLRTLDAYWGEPASDFKKCENIEIEVTLENCNMQPVDAVVFVAVYDDVGTIIGACHIIVEVPAENPWCTPGEVTETVSIHIPKWAYVGAHAMVYANAYTAWPWTSISEPWCPEASASIQILKAP